MTDLYQFAVDADNVPMARYLVQNGLDIDAICRYKDWSAYWG